MTSDGPGPPGHRRRHGDGLHDPGRPEADGTLAWSSATLVIAHVVGGALDPAGGVLRPDRSRPGLGLALKDANAGPYRTA